MKTAYSIKTIRVKEPDFPYDGHAINNTAELVQFAKNLYDADVEKMLAIYLDAQNKIICIKVDKGTVNKCNVYPREILRHALLVNASALILVHNHPSGNLEPSDEDVNVTKLMLHIARVLDIDLHEHLILADGQFCSIRKSALIEGWN